MNQEIIKRIAGSAGEFAYGQCQQLGRPGGQQDHVWLTLYVGRVYELTIRECGQVADPASRQTIYQHFGVTDP